ncbi:hypothetical protein SAMN02745121_09082 [Nannocystis exedens]|uniref:Pyrrolo-quinoline quinone repeat domain-containing protein n=1 Tax=Nannocystis exedens TaxID=54 RepID=A0A1I2J2V4_9BACT|nr:hypothetical protein NAEX_00214 [Nannocystis exedens]SFF47266.1 hypothetical protein SAMN02745121_09082 [Nannocystis exedens]
MFEARAADVVALPGSLVALDGDLIHLRGLDPATGAELWRTRRHERPGGVHTLYPLGERVLLHAGEVLAIVDARDGALLEHREMWEYGDCELQIFRGMYGPRGREHVPWGRDDVACGFACGCEIQPFDCTLGTRQRPFSGASARVYHSKAAPHDDVCLNPPRLLGRVKGRTLAMLPVDFGHRLAALDGDEIVWRESEQRPVVNRFSTIAGDTARDVCWALDHAEMAVWTCSTGRLLWRASQPDGALLRERVTLAGDRLLVERRTAGRNTVEALAVMSGTRIWKRELAADRVLLVDAGLPDPPRSDGVVYLRLDPATGRTLAEFRLAPKESLWRDPAGGYIRAGGAAYVEFDPEGRERRQIVRDMSDTTWLDEHFIVQTAPDRLTVLRRSTLDVVLSAEGQFAVVESTAALGPGVLLLREHRKNEPLRIALLRAEP